MVDQQLLYLIYYLADLFTDKVLVVINRILLVGGASDGGICGDMAFCPTHEQM